MGRHEAPRDPGCGDPGRHRAPHEAQHEAPDDERPWAAPVEERVVPALWGASGTLAAAAMALILISGPQGIGEWFPQPPPLGSGPSDPGPGGPRRGGAADPDVSQAAGRLSPDLGGMGSSVRGLDAFLVGGADLQTTSALVSLCTGAALARPSMTAVLPVSPAPAGTVVATVATQAPPSAAGSSQPAPSAAGAPQPASGGAPADPGTQPSSPPTAQQPGPEGGSPGPSGTPIAPVTETAQPAVQPVLESAGQAAAPVTKVVESVVEPVVPPVVDRATEPVVTAAPKPEPKPEPVPVPVPVQDVVAPVTKVTEPVTEPLPKVPDVPEVDSVPSLPGGVSG